MSQLWCTLFSLRPSMRIHFFTVVLAFCLFGSGSSLRCGKTNEFDNQDFFSCPRPYDDRDAVFCCGNRCCKSFFEADHMDVIGKSSPNANLIDVENSIPNLNDAKAEKRSLVKGLASIVGIVIGVVLFVLIVCVVCCCCCPFCIIAKRRKAGRVLRTGNADVAREAARINPHQHGYLPPPQQQQQPMATYPQQQQQGYAPPPQSYGYPQQQPYAYPAQGGTGPYPAAPNVPMPYPPPYTPGPQPLQQQHPEGYQSQPPFNPNF